MEVAHPTDINFNLSYSPVLQCKKNSGSRSKRSVCSIRMPPYNKPVLKNSYFIADVYFDRFHLLNHACYA